MVALTHWCHAGCLWVVAVLCAGCPRPPDEQKAMELEPMYFTILKKGGNAVVKDYDTTEVFDRAEKLFTEGKTPLLDGFISKRTKRPFKAHLTLDFETGKIGFEFAPRPTKKAVKKTAAK